MTIKQTTALRNTMFFSNRLKTEYIMQNNGKYYIIGKNNGVTYYYHSNKRFYWNIFHLASCSFKVWASKKYAEMAFDEIINRNNRFDSISLMFYEYNKNESITIKSK